MPHLAKLQAENAAGKMRVTMYLDAAVVQAFRNQTEAEGKGYQTLINDVLRKVISQGGEPMTFRCRGEHNNALHADGDSAALSIPAGEGPVGLKTKLNTNVMTATVRKMSTTIPTNLIAPCGMNCHISGSASQ